jgi:tricarballylate dehydrogenase
MSAHGVSWQQPLAGTLHLGRTNRWFLGGGKALLNTYYQTARRMGICIRYDVTLEDLVIENGRFDGVRLKNGDTDEFIRGRAVVVAAGGYEANIEWLKKHWGDAADNFIIRGTPYNDGMLLATLLKKGAKAIGDPKGFHAIAVDARSPKFDGGIVTRLDAIPFGIVVNQQGRRFYDEGENIWPVRMKRWEQRWDSTPKCSRKHLRNTIARLLPTPSFASRFWMESARAASPRQKVIGRFPSIARRFTGYRCGPELRSPTWE